MDEAMTIQVDDKAESSAGGGALKIALLAVAGVGLYFLGGKAAALLPQFAGWVEGLGFWGPVVFVFAYALGVVGFVPGSILTLAAGAIFGLAEGTLYVFVAASLGACAAFLVSRYLARAMIEKRIEGNAKFAAIDRAAEEEGRKIVFLLRLTPAVPFSLLNYALGLTRVRFSDYALACIGMLPGTILYVYYGTALRSVADLASGQSVEKGAEFYIFLAVGLAATIAVTAVVTKMARKALDEATG